MPAYPPQDRLIRKETALGTLRDLEPPKSHIGRTICPPKDVGTDDVIFDFARGLADGMVPARAEDAEAELAQKDVMMGGTGRASLIDWAEKTRYSASDVSRYREALYIAGRLGENGVTNVPLGVGSQIQDFRSKVASDDALRRRKLDNRLEWLAMTPLDTAGLSYDDGKIKFAVDYGRPLDQTNQAPSGGLFSLSTSNPVGAITAMQELMYARYGIRMTRAITSQKVINSLWNSDRFIATTGLVVGGTPSSPIDMRYLVDGWSPTMAKEKIERATGVNFTVYDSVYRTRSIGSTTITNVRFTNENKIYFLPDEESIADLDDMIGFGAMLSSPHPEGNWTSGFYEWEEETKDPWGVVRGAGIKSFPVYPHLDWTYTMTVL